MFSMQAAQNPKPATPLKLCGVCQASNTGEEAAGDSAAGPSGTQGTQQAPRTTEESVSATAEVEATQPASVEPRSLNRAEL